MSSLFRPHQSFLQTSAWQTQAKNALRYNASQVGLALPMLYGTVRQQVNVIAFGGYRGTGGGKKGKGVGPLPIGGTSQSGKGGGGGKKGGKKATPDFSVDVDFGLCEGPVDVEPNNNVWASAQVAPIHSLPLNVYVGTNGQAADPTAISLGATVNYSGTCHVTATPMDLGPNPTLPNMSIEINGRLWGTFPGSVDADPGQVIQYFLLDPQRGCGWLAEHIDYDAINLFSAYCQAVGFGVSVALDAQQTGLDWLAGFIKLLNTTMVWSGDVLKFIPYADSPIGSWDPHLVAQYNLTDDDFLSDKTKFEDTELTIGTDPIQVSRINVYEIPNWISIEYLDRSNNYNSTILAAFDQSSIDVHGLRIGDNFQGKQFANATAAQVSVQTILQRMQYTTETAKFRLGYRFSLLEPMDILLMNPTMGDTQLDGALCRIHSIEENDNGDLSLECEMLTQGVGHPQVSYNNPPRFPTWGSCGPSWNFNDFDPVTGYPMGLQHMENPNFQEDNPAGTISIWVEPELGGMQGSGDPSGHYAFIFTAYADGAFYWDGRYREGTTQMQSPYWDSSHTAFIWNQTGKPPVTLFYYGDGKVVIYFCDYPADLHNPFYPTAVGRWETASGALRFVGWSNIYLAWDFSTSGEPILVINGVRQVLTLNPAVSFGTVRNVGWHAAAFCGCLWAAALLYYASNVVGCFTDFWFVRGVSLGPGGWANFMQGGKAVYDLGYRGGNPLIGKTPQYPDMFYRNTLGTSEIDMFLGTFLDHSKDPPVSGGILGAVTPVPCYNEPW